LTRDPKRVVRFLDDAEALCAAAADEFVRASRGAIEARGRFRVALSGGSTPKRLHELLTRSRYREQVAWGRVEFYFGDERAVPPEHPDSNYRMARESLFDPLEIDASQIHRMHAEQLDLDVAARAYEALIAQDFGVAVGTPPPRFDLILLGMGTDGHTASLFPNTRALRERDRWVVNNDVPQLSASRMTLSYPLINRAERIVFLISGRDKAEAVARVLEGPEDPSNYPAQGILPDPGSLLVLIDRAAGELLNPN
jgi:6-phosphogluconolactonase